MVPRSQGQGQGPGMYMNLNGDNYQSGGDNVASQVSGVAKHVVFCHFLSYVTF